MLKLGHVQNHKLFYVILTVMIFVFGGTYGTIQYYGAHAMAKQESETKEKLEKIDNQIATIKAKKLAEKKAKEEAERKAKEDAERKKAADEALVASLRGQAITPSVCAVKGAHGDPNQIDVVINKKRCFNPINFAPGDIASYGGYPISAKILADLTTMVNVASAAGIPISLTSAYRSYSNQVTTYNNWVTVNGSYAAADTVSARPGYSEHQTGFAVDLSCGGASLDKFTGSSCHNWLIENGANYGFIQRYQPGYESITGYSAESWHWRYVGAATAQQMKSSGIKTLEQLWNLPGGNY